MRKRSLLGAAGVLALIAAAAVAYFVFDGLDPVRKRGVVQPEAVVFQAILGTVSVGMLVAFAIRSLAHARGADRPRVASPLLWAGSVLATLAWAFVYLLAYSTGLD
jgi:hypothetical protein